MRYLVHVVFVSLGLLALSVPAYTQSVNEEPVTRQITSGDGDLYSWLHHGSLFLRTYGSDKKGQYFYRGRSGALVPISNVEAFSTMICEQFTEKKAMLSFLNDDLPRVIFAFFGSMHSDVIDKEYFDYRATLPAFAWRGASDKDVQQSGNILRKYEYHRPTIKDEKWHTDFSASLPDGSIEMWTLDGEVQPFLVIHLKKTIVEKPGTVIPVPEVGS
jgi:hypothetical protein